MNTRIVLLGIAIALIILLIPGSAMGWSPYGYGPGWSGPAFAPPMAETRRLNVRRSADRDNYYLTVQLQGIAPEAVSVSVEGGRWLLIEAQDTAQTREENVAEDQTAYYRSFSYSSSRFDQRIPLPRDADAANMSRANESDRVEITIPRIR